MTSGWPPGPVAAWPHPMPWRPEDPGAPIVDYHAHVVLAGVEGRAGALGPESGVGPDGCPWFRVGGYRLEGVDYADTAFTELDRRLEAMELLGIDAQVISPNPLTYLHHADPVLARDFARWHNDEVAALVDRAPERLAGFAQVPIQAPELAIEELERAVRDLHLVGPYLGTEVGRDLDDPELEPFWAACELLEVPVFLHPGLHGVDGPVLDARLSRFDLELTLGFCFEETVGLAQLLFGGVLHRHPRLQVCLSHGGGAVAWLRERWQRAVEVRSWSPEWLREPGQLDAALAQVWFDAHTGGPASQGFLADTVGTDRLLFGTNLAGWDAPQVTAARDGRPRRRGSPRP